jgi:hypothetical protein
MSSRQPTYFLSLPRKKVSKERGTLPHRSALGADCSALLGLCSARRTRFVRYAHCAQTNGAKSVHEACCARRCKALRCSTAPKGPKSNTVVCCANFPCPTSLRIGRDGEAEPWSRCAARRIWCSGPRGWRRGAQGFGAARASALRQLTSRRLFERSGRRPRSEFGAGPKPRAPQSSPAQPDRHRRVAFSWLLLLAKQKK